MRIPLEYNREVKILWCYNLFHSTYEMASFSHMKFLLHIGNELVQNVTCEILGVRNVISHMNWKIHTWNLISHMKLPFRTWNWNNSYVKYYFHMWNGMWNFSRGLSQSKHILIFQANVICLSKATTTIALIIRIYFDIWYNTILIVHQIT